MANSNQSKNAAEGSRISQLRQQSHLLTKSKSKRQLKVRPSSAQSVSGRSLGSQQRQVDGGAQPHPKLSMEKKNVGMGIGEAFVEIEQGTEGIAGIGVPFRETWKNPKRGPGWPYMTRAERADEEERDVRKMREELANQREEASKVQEHVAVLERQMKEQDLHIKAVLAHTTQLSAPFGYGLGSHPVLEPSTYSTSLPRGGLQPGLIVLEHRKELEKTLVVKRLHDQIDDLRASLARREEELLDLRRSTSATALAEAVAAGAEFEKEVIRLREVIKSRGNASNASNSSVSLPVEHDLPTSSGPTSSTHNTLPLDGKSATCCGVEPVGPEVTDVSSTTDPHTNRVPNPLAAAAYLSLPHKQDSSRGTLTEYSHEAAEAGVGGLQTGGGTHPGREQYRTCSQNQGNSEVYGKMRRHRHNKRRGHWSRSGLLSRAEWERTNGPAIHHPVLGRRRGGGDRAEEQQDTEMIDVLKGVVLAQHDRIQKQRLKLLELERHLREVRTVLTTQQGWSLPGGSRVEAGAGLRWSGKCVNDNVHHGTRLTASRSAPVRLSSNTQNRRHQGTEFTHLSSQYMKSKQGPTNSKGSDLGEAIHQGQVQDIQSSSTVARESSFQEEDSRKINTESAAVVDAAISSTQEAARKYPQLSATCEGGGNQESPHIEERGRIEEGDEGVKDDGKRRENTSKMEVGDFGDQLGTEDFELLPEGWAAAVDEASGRFYFYSAHRSTWVRPTLPASPRLERNRQEDSHPTTMTHLEKTTDMAGVDADYDAEVEAETVREEGKQDQFLHCKE